ncbi:hypothetical protein BJ508DRAFT_418224 [Ascobolus immersus RN42]|uniref:BTB domain-containing protein n=1 Tax=Ascobolus immersus RN42 TaxID=1160509 RepID=A0A3N4I094_ASCIM|nr:hypothetical protein BJ508DRAFT_418224 [Ascobolus immersus RN42]
MADAQLPLPDAFDVAESNTAAPLGGVEDTGEAVGAESVEGGGTQQTSTVQLSLPEQVHNGSATIEANSNSNATQAPAAQSENGPQAEAPQPTETELSQAQPSTEASTLVDHSTQTEPPSTALTVLQSPPEPTPASNPPHPAAIRPLSIRGARILSANLDSNTPRTVYKTSSSATELNGVLKRLMWPTDKADDFNDFIGELAEAAQGAGMVVVRDESEEAEDEAEEPGYSLKRKASESASPPPEKRLQLADLPEVLPEDMFARDGDLILAVCDDNFRSGFTTFRVSSRVLMSSSSVFASMLDHERPFLEGERLKRWTYGMDPVVIELEDNPAALRLVLRIVHHQNRKIGKDIGLVEFANLAVLVDKYDLYDTVQLWADIWRKALKKRMKEYVREEAARYLVMIAWVFGFEEEFVKATRTIIRRYVLKDGLLQYSFQRADPKNPDGPKITEWVPLLDETPSQLTDRLKETMALSRSLLMSAFTREKERRLNSIGTACTKRISESPKTPSTKLVCDRFQLGCMLPEEERVAAIFTDWKAQQENLSSDAGFFATVQSEVSLLECWRQIRRLQSDGSDGWDLYYHVVPTEAQIREYGSRRQLVAHKDHAKCSWVESLRVLCKVKVKLGLELIGFTSRRERFGLEGKQGLFNVEAEHSSEEEDAGRDGEVVVVSGDEEVSGSEEEDGEGVEEEEEAE